MTTTMGRFGLAAAVAVLAACGQPVRLQQLQVAPVVTEVTENLQADVIATAVYDDGSTRDVTAEVAWSTVDAGVASAAAGRVQAGAPGRTYVTAAYAGLQASARVDVVAATIVSLEVTSDAATVPAGLSARLTATGTFSDGSVRDVTTAAEWTASGAVEVLPGGQVHALNWPGLAMVRATVGQAMAAVRLEVTAAAALELTVVGASAPLPLGLAHDFHVLARYTDGTTRDVTGAAAVSVADGAVATLDGLYVRGVAPGLTELQASFSGLSAAAPITVAAAAVQAISVTASRPDGSAAVLVRAGDLLFFSATAALTDGTTRDVTSDVTWTTSDPGVAIVSNDIKKGAVLAFTPGTVTIAALEPQSQIGGSLALVVAP